MKKFVPIIFLALIVSGGLWVSKKNDPAPQPFHKPNIKNAIVVTDEKFEPARITIKQGETVTFINQGKDIHWPASDDHPTHEEYSEFDSKKPLNPGASWSFTFNRQGVWKYHDHLYPSLSGEIVVEP